MEYLIFAVAALLIIVCLMGKGYLDYKQDQKIFIKKLYENYGVLPEKEYKPEQYATISHYFERHKDGFYVDDITWNYMDMDEIFIKINAAYSVAGEEYLYYLLRTPCAPEEEMAGRERLITFFTEHPEERVSCQYHFHKLGRCGKFSIYDYLEYLDNLGERNNRSHYLAILLFLATVLIMFFNLPIGLFALVSVLVINNLTYFRERKEIEPYITSFSYILRLLEAADQIGKLSAKPLKEELTLLKTAGSSMNSFRRGSSLIMSAGGNATGNPLDFLMDFLKMWFHFDLIKFNQMLLTVRSHIGEIDQILTVLGKMEAMIAIGAYRKSHDYCIPEFTSQRALKVEGAFHPLIEDPVSNDFASEGKSILITGSNASGKSTFLKTIAICAIMAQTVHTCPAASYSGCRFRIVSSMSLRDDVRGGSSYYMVEIRALKRIMDLISEGAELPVLCFVDEVLRGTNTVERIAASTEILKTMAEGNCICFAATHDIELTHLLEAVYQNYHFEEQIEKDDIFFSYKILKGRASSRNAIKLLGIMGYEKEIIGEAEKLAEDFVKTGKWHGLDLQKV